MGKPNELERIIGGQWDGQCGVNLERIEIELLGIERERRTHLVKSPSVQKKKKSENI